MEGEKRTKELGVQLDWHSTRLSVVYGGEGLDVQGVAYGDDGRIYARVNGVIFVADVSFKAGSSLDEVLAVEVRKGVLTEDSIVTEGEIIIDGSSSSTALQRIGTPESGLYLNPEKHQIWQPI